jgi:hypothetical protein
MNMSIGVQLSPLSLATSKAATAERSLAAEGFRRELAFSAGPAWEALADRTMEPGLSRIRWCHASFGQTMRHCACREIRRRFRCPT